MSLPPFVSSRSDAFRAFHLATTARIAQMLGDRVVEVADVPGGFSAAARWRIRLERRGHLFAKIGTSPYTAAALRFEKRAYDVIRASFMPAFLGWEDHPDHPILLIEDLTLARWPPPWTPDMIEATLDTLRALHSMTCALPSFSEAHALENGWLAVADDPAPFLSLNLVSSDWLDGALPCLIRAAAQVNTAGAETIHFDVRSGNMCVIPGRRVVLIDWNWSCLGNGALDTGFWLPSLHAEGGPPPDTLMPHRPDVAAWVSGFFAARAGLPLRGCPASC